MRRHTSFKAVSLLLLFTLTLLVELPVLIKNVKATPDILYEYLGSIEDTYVDSAHPNTNYGSSTHIDTDSGQTDNVITRSYLKFNLSQFSETPLNFSLRLYMDVLFGPLSSPDQDIECRQVSNQTWQEENVTWNDKPSYADIIDTLNCSNIASSYWYEWNVTSWCDTAWSGTKIVSFLLKQTNENVTLPLRGNQWSSEENTKGNDPELWIAYEGEYDESSNPSFYDDFEDGAIGSVWSTVQNSPTEAAGKLNCSNIPSGVVYNDLVNAQNSIIQIDFYDEGIDNAPYIVLRDRFDATIDPSDITTSHDSYILVGWREDAAHSWWYRVYRTVYNGSYTTLASDVQHQAIDTILQINITTTHIYFDEIYNNVKYNICNETYSLSTYWLYFYIYEDAIGSTWTQYESVEFIKSWRTDTLRQYNDNLNTNGHPYIYDNVYTIMSLDYTPDELSFDLDARSGVTSTTEIYCGSKGEPVIVDVDDEEADWSYDESNSIATITIHHSSLETVELLWSEALTAMWETHRIMYRSLALLGIVVLVAIAAVAVAVNSSSLAEYARDKLR